MNLSASADAAPVGMWTTHFALPTCPQTGSAVLAASAANAPITVAAGGWLSGWTIWLHQYPDRARHSVT